MLQVHVSRRRTGLMIALALAFVAIGVFLIGRPGDLAPIIGWIAALCFGACAVAGARQLLRTGPVIEVGPAGFRWRRWSDVTIPWSAIARIEVRAMRAQPFLCLHLTDPAAYPSQRLTGRLAGTNRVLGFGDIAVSPTGTDTSFAQLTAVVDRYRPIDVR